MENINNNIQESYVTFEVAKLLKAKGFDVHCDRYFKNSKNVVVGVGNYNSTDQDKDEPHFSQPTTSLAIKWIRENFNIHIKIDWFANEDNSIEWDYSIQRIGTNIDKEGNSEYLRDYDPLAGFKFHEDAENAALLYCLKHLI